MDDVHKYIYFYTIDATNTHTTSGYTLPITPFKFVPVFDDGNSSNYSKQNILWDFGDGQTSELISPTHHFTMPGWYNVKCYVLGKNGIGYIDKFSQNILVKDFITDTISISSANPNKKVESGKRATIQLHRFNSWQNYQALSSEGYTINLNISGNNSEYLNVDTYSKDKWGHLKPSSRFESLIHNNITEKYESLPINKVKTTNNEIYVKLLNSKIVLCDKNDTGSCFAGTSGSVIVDFIDDVPKEITNLWDNTSVTIFTSFDLSKFKDFDNINKKYPETKYSTLNSVFEYNFPSIIQQLDSDHITITSNGIDDDNNGNKITSFDIYEEKFTNQKIPFVAKIKNINNRPSKFNPILKYVDNESVDFGEIFIELRDERNQKIDNVSISANFGVLSSEKYGGYFKGYLISDRELNNVHIYAKTNVILQEIFLVDSAYAVIGEPQSEKFHKITIKNDVANHSLKILNDDLVQTNGLSGIYSSCVTYLRDKTTNDVSPYVWVVDADREKVKKYDAIKNELIYEDFIIPENSSPSNICSDRDGNVWITLYDSISTIRINQISNLVDTVIVPSLSNIENNYENSVTPASIDTDYTNNVWISYSNQLSSFVEKYDQYGNPIVTINLTPNHQSTEIITDLNLNLWGIMKTLSSDSIALSSKNDKLFKIDKDGTTLSSIYIGGSLGNIAIDIRGNVWLTKNINEVVKYNTNSHAISTFKINTNSSNENTNYISDFEGIACTTDNNILIVDNFNKKLWYFNCDVETRGFNPSSMDLNSIGTLPSNRIQDKSTAYGDWNGFRYINKFQHIFTGNHSNKEGISNTFSIYNSISGKYDLRKLNENFDPNQQMKSYRFQEYLENKDILFDNFIGTVIGNSESNPTELGKLIYEKISNFSDNINNVDVCNVKSLKSLYSMLDENFYTFNDIEYNLPSELNRLIDMFSINFSKLKGSRNKFSENFDTKGYNNDAIRTNSGNVIYGINKGAELDFMTSVLSAGSYIVAYEKFSETYKLLNTSVLSSDYIQYIDPINKTYTLSSYHPYWGWGLSVPDDQNNELIPLYYSFYEYLSGYSNIQSEGVINWEDPHTTVYENISSAEQWDKIRENMIYYSLAKGLRVIK